MKNPFVAAAMMAAAFAAALRENAERTFYGENYKAAPPLRGARGPVGKRGLPGSKLAKKAAKHRIGICNIH